MICIKYSKGAFYDGGITDGGNLEQMQYILCIVNTFKNFSVPFINCKVTTITVNATIIHNILHMHPV